MGIYVHIPFCVRKCKYCDFLSAPAKEAVRRAYVKRLKEEIYRFEGQERYETVSVFFGGGTPSLLEGEQIGEIIEELEKKFRFGTIREAKEKRMGEPEDGRPEITVECNPGTLTREKLRIYREWGVNRLSLGLQSADNEELRRLGRIHNWEEFRENYEQAQAAGFCNINVDLMSALPGQTLDSWERTLKKVLELKPKPKHISAYSLIIEEGTPFYEMYGEGRGEEGSDLGERYAPLPDEDTEREMYYRTEQILREAGLCRYEISNYACPGWESVHNCGYWLRREYVGFGLGASSQLGKLRYKNTDCLEDYLKGDFSKKELQVLTKDQEIEETMYLGLRMVQGVNLKWFAETFGVSAEIIYKKELESLKRQGLIQIEGGRLRLTPLGIDVSNRVLAEFLLE